MVLELRALAAGALHGTRSELFSIKCSTIKENRLLAGVQSLVMNLLQFFSSEQTIVILLLIGQRFTEIKIKFF